MLGILRIIGIIVVFYFILLAHRENHREYTRKMEQFKKAGKLPDKKTTLLRILWIIGVMTPVPLIATIVVINVRKIEFSALNLFSGLIVFIIVEAIIVSILGFIQMFVMDSRERGLKKAIITLLLTIISVAFVLYIKYKW